MDVGDTCLSFFLRAMKCIYLFLLPLKCCWKAVDVVVKIRGESKSEGGGEVEGEVGDDQQVRVGRFTVVIATYRPPTRPRFRST